LFSPKNKGPNKFDSAVPTFWRLPIMIPSENSFSCRWHGKQIPIVRFLNGREILVTPEKFTSDVPGHGMCKRMQVSQDILAGQIFLART
jgi:hypothetical protein